MRLRSFIPRASAGVIILVLLSLVGPAFRARPAYAACSGSGSVDSTGGSADGDCGGPAGPTPPSGPGGGSAGPPCEANGQPGHREYEYQGPVDEKSQVGNPLGGDGTIGIPYGTPAAWYLVWCVLPDGSRVSEGSQALATSAVTPVDPTVLRDRARARVKPPAPVLSMAPTGDDRIPAIVQMPTWLAVSGGWAPITETESEGAVTVSVTATPRAVLWTMGDGHSQSCGGPGVVWHSGLPEDATNCSYTYGVDSSGERDGRYHGSARVSWDFTWALNGTPQGEFGTVGSTTPFTMRVGEIQVIAGPGDR